MCCWTHYKHDLIFAGIYRGVADLNTESEGLRSWYPDASFSCKHTSHSRELERPGECERTETRISTPTHICLAEKLSLCYARNKSNTALHEHKCVWNGTCFSSVLFSLWRYEKRYHAIYVLRRLALNVPLRQLGNAGNMWGIFSTSSAQRTSQRTLSTNILLATATWHGP